VSVDGHAKYMLSHYWKLLVDSALIGYITMQDLTVKNELLREYHTCALKFLVQMLNCKSGRKIVIEDAQKGASLIFFCLKSLKSENADIIYLATQLL
jgi:hypothetical protein